MGFLNMEDKTREALDKDGGLHTGDLSKIDTEGFSYIIRRIKGRAISENKAIVRKLLVLVPQRPTSECMWTEYFISLFGVINSCNVKVLSVSILLSTARGENVPPVSIEGALKKELPIISSAMLIYDKEILLMLLTLKVIWH